MEIDGPQLDTGEQASNEASQSTNRIADAKATNSVAEPSSSASATDELSLLGVFKVLLPPSRPVPSNSSDVQDDFFTPTSDELRTIQASLSARARNLQEAPLLTEKLRLEREKERRNRWPTATIRVKFADRTMLEKVFTSSDKIKSVYAFVRSCLREDIRPYKFVLYDTPPRRELKVSDPIVRDKSLYELQLAPQSVLMFQFLEEELKLDVPTRPPPLLPAVLSKATPLSPQLDPQDKPRPVERKTITQPSSSSPGSSTEKKLPKWLKLGKK